MENSTHKLIIVKTAMSGSDYTTLSHLLKKIQGEKYTPNIFKVNADKSAMITDYLEKERLIYEIYHNK